MIGVRLMDRCNPAYIHTLNRQSCSYARTYRYRIYRKRMPRLAAPVTAQLEVAKSEAAAEFGCTSGDLRSA